MDIKEWRYKKYNLTEGTGQRGRAGCSAHGSAQDCVRGIDKERSRFLGGGSGTSVALLTPTVGHDLQETGETVVEMNDLDKHVNLVSKVQRQSRGGETKTKWTKRSVQVTL